MECVLCYYPCSTTPDWKRDLLPPLSVFQPLSSAVSPPHVLPSLFFILPSLSCHPLLPPLPPSSPSEFCYSCCVDTISSICGVSAAPRWQRNKVVETPYKVLDCEYEENCATEREKTKDFDLVGHVSWIKKSLNMCVCVCY